MDRDCLGTCGAIANRIWIDGGRVKSVAAENRHIDSLRAVGIYPIGIAVRSEVYETSSLTCDSIAPISHLPTRGLPS